MKRIFGGRTSVKLITRPATFSQRIKFYLKFQAGTTQFYFIILSATRGGVTRTCCARNMSTRSYFVRNR